MGHPRRAECHRLMRLAFFNALARDTLAPLGCRPRRQRRVSHDSDAGCRIVAPAASEQHVKGDEGEQGEYEDTRHAMGRRAAMLHALI
eukprot:3148268-Pyramimonas_sp.AAC.1